MRKKETTLRVNKEKENTEITSKKEELKDEGGKVSSKTSEEALKTESKEKGSTVKGELEVIKNVEVNKGVNEVKTEAGSTLIVIRGEDDKFSFVVSKPERTEYGKEETTSKNIKGVETDSSFYDKGSVTSKEEIKVEKSTSEKDKKTNSKLNIKAVIVLIIAGVALVYFVYRRFKNKIKLI